MSKKNMPMRIGIILNKIYKRLNNENLKSWDLAKLRVNTRSFVWDFQDSEIPSMAQLYDEFLIYEHVGHNGDSNLSSFNSYEKYTARIYMIMHNDFIEYAIGIVDGKIDYCKK